MILQAFHALLLALLNRDDLFQYSALVGFPGLSQVDPLVDALQIVVKHLVVQGDVLDGRDVSPHRHASHDKASKHRPQGYPAQHPAIGESPSVVVVHLNDPVPNIDCCPKFTDEKEAVDASIEKAVKTLAGWLTTTGARCRIEK